MNIIEGKTFDCTNKHTGLKLTGENHLVRNCHFAGNTATNFGIDLVDVKNVRIEGCTFSQMLSAIQISGATGVSFVNNRVTQWRTYGVILRGGTDVLIKDNIFSTPRLNDALIANPTPEALTAERKRPKQSIASYGPTKRLRVIGNVCKGVGRPHPIGSGDQIAIREAEDFDVSGNHSLGGGENGITIVASRRGIVRGNHVSGCDGHGIQVGTRDKSAGSDSSQIAIIGNICVNNGRRLDPTARDSMTGIYVQDLSDSYISDNLIIDDGEKRGIKNGINISESRNIVLGTNVIRITDDKDTLPIVAYASTVDRQWYLQGGFEVRPVSELIEERLFALERKQHVTPRKSTA